LGLKASLAARADRTSYLTPDSSLAAAFWAVFGVAQAQRMIAKRPRGKKDEGSFFIGNSGEYINISKLLLISNIITIIKLVLDSVFD
jgi:hypothetical protein